MCHHTYVKYAYVCVSHKDSPAVLPGASALHLIEQNFNKREASSDRSFKFSLYCTTRQNSSFSTKDILNVLASRIVSLRDEAK